MIGKDDGPSSNTEAVLDVLKAKGVHATFFINGDNFEHVDDETTRNKMNRIIEEVFFRTNSKFNQSLNH